MADDSSNSHSGEEEEERVAASLSSSSSRTSSSKQTSPAAPAAQAHRKQKRRVSKGFKTTERRDSQSDKASSAGDPDGSSTSNTTGAAKDTVNNSAEESESDNSTASTKSTGSSARFGANCSAKKEKFNKRRSAKSSTASHEFSASSARDSDKKSSIVVKVAMIGDSQIGKTSLMVKYVEGTFDEDYIQTLGVNFMEKTITLRGNEITFSIWDLGGQREFVSMLPLVCNEAVALLFMFDLSRKSSLSSIKEWYRQARGFNKSAIPFLIGTKYDAFVNLSYEEQSQITKQARKFAKAMRAPLIFCSTREGIHLQKIFKIVLAKAFDLNCTIRQVTNVGEPILEYS